MIETEDDVVLVGTLESAPESDGERRPTPEMATRRTGSPGHESPHPSRMSLMDALRELTVRRASSAAPNR